ncbi:MAG TPA: EamA family transporter [Anaerolineales bacterium]|nr:EamA family transporter [Anaerolineales bacterium]
MREANSLRSDKLTLAGFAVLVLLASANVIAVKFSNQELPPFWGAGTRFAVATVLFYGIVLFQRLKIPRGRALFGAILYGILQFGLGFALAYWALLGISASLASVMLATVPLFTLLFAFFARLESIRIHGVLGALLAIAGTAIIFGTGTGKTIPTVYFLAAFGAIVCFSLAPVVVKLYPQIHPAVMNTVGMFTGTLILLGLSLLFGESAVVPNKMETWMAQFYLITLGSVGIFGLILFLLKRWTASGVSYQTVLSPIVTFGLSAWLLGEPLTSGLFVGSIFVIAGVYIGALAPNRNST